MPPDDATEDDERDRPSPTNKIERIAGRYGLPDLGETLAERWTASEDRDSLRDLAAYVNRRVLASAVRDSGGTLVDGEAGNLYRLLSDEEVDGASRIEARRRLQRSGVEVERLEGDFVSHQAVYTYLTKHRNVTPPTAETSEADRLEGGIETVQRLKGRLESVAESLLRDLRNAGFVHLGEFTVLVNANVFCHECGQQYDLVAFIGEGVCDCRPSD